MNNSIFQAVHVLAWIIFVGLCIEAGGLLVNFIFHFLSPENIDKLYQKMNFLQLLHEHVWLFMGLYSFSLVISFLKVTLFYVVITLMYSLNLSNPFCLFVAKKINQICYITFSIGLLNSIALQLSQNSAYKNINTSEMSNYWIDSHAFILMSAIIYIISLIFNKGVELQSENDLTV